ncbi:hypothetical protein SSX86_011811 [Deinandra increscens subsp. villosa]|uniref:Uncharacterized protein n=1 Tax=Deinandra increscens subsp. villosa TaxID=3103831 RepID=A0AAP0D7K0_9ASTR
MADAPSNKKPSNLAGEEGEKAMSSGSEKVCEQCEQNDKKLLFLCKICGSNNFCEVCVTEPKWACPVCCNPKLEQASNDDLRDQFAEMPDIFNGDDTNHSNGWLYESEDDGENPTDTDHQDATPDKDERNDVGLWKGNDVGEVAKEMLQAVENRYPETFQGVQIRPKPYWLSILKELHVFLKSFLETSGGALGEDQVTSLEGDLNEFERFGFNLSWARKKLDMVKNLKFGNHPLKMELLKAEARLEKARLDYESATNARNKMAHEMAQKLRGEYEDVLNGTLGHGMLADNLGFVQLRVKQEKKSSSIMIYKHILSSKKLKKFRSLAHRNSPKNFYNAMKCLSMVQKRKIADIGFGSLLEFNCSFIPSKLGFFIVDKFDPESMKLKLKNGEIQITPELINKIFGIPNGGTPLLTLSSKDSTKDCYVKWHSQFAKELKPSDIVQKIHESEDGDMVFILNFIILFLNSIIECIHSRTCKVDLLERFDEDVDIKSIDWCGYIYDCLKKCKLGWNRDKINSYFIGPITVLMLIYLDQTLFTPMETPINGRAITFWSGNMMKERELLEIESGGFGHCEIRTLSVTQEQSVSEFEGMNIDKEQQNASDIPSFEKDVENVDVVNMQNVEVVTHQNVRRPRRMKRRSWTKKLK